MPPDWNAVLKNELDAPYFSALCSEIKKSYGTETVFPPAHQVFRAFQLCPFSNLKVVIIGQDPYHAAGQADGLCFSVNEGVRLPPSLRNIFKELESDVPGFVMPAAGDLRAWARQGVLLLNAVLTVKEASAGSHRALGWEKFTDAVINIISERKQAVVFLLWGNYAMAKRPLINADKHFVLTAAHPSPLARGAFAGCRHFSKTNAWLRAKGLSPIVWPLT